MKARAPAISCGEHLCNLPGGNGKSRPVHVLYFVGDRPRGWKRASGLERQTDADENISTPPIL